VGQQEGGFPVGRLSWKSVLWRKIRYDTRKKRTTAGDKTICLPLTVEDNYEAFVKDTSGYREYLDHMIALYPELFPAGIEKGYRFHGFVESGKLHLTTRLASANQAVRAMALIWNFHPYCEKVQSRPPYSRSPFQDLNGFCYHEHWLRNLMIAASLNGRGTAKPSPHKLN
jgi:hypothetical protein